MNSQAYKKLLLERRVKMYYRREVEKTGVIITRYRCGHCNSSVVVIKGGKDDRGISLNR